MKNKNSIYVAFCLLSSVLIMTSCETDDNGGDINHPTTEGISPVFNPNLTYGSMTDQDGNTYKTIQIGEQTWMAENLRTTKFRNGDVIPNVTNDETWYGLTSGAYCVYNNDLGLKNAYGLLYNWYAVNDTRILAPTGWHVANASDWGALSDYLGGNLAAGPKLKEADTLHWKKVTVYGLIQGTNQSGFTGLPAGRKSVYFTPENTIAVGYSFAGIRESTGWWILEQTGRSPRVQLRSLGNGTNYFDGSNGQYNLGLSVRCVKD